MKKTIIISTLLLILFSNAMAQYMIYWATYQTQEVSPLTGEPYTRNVCVCEAKNLRTGQVIYPPTGACGGAEAAPKHCDQVVDVPYSYVIASKAVSKKITPVPASKTRPSYLPKYHSIFSKTTLPKVDNYNVEQSLCNVSLPAISGPSHNYFETAYNPVVKKPSSVTTWVTAYNSTTEVCTCTSANFSTAPPTISFPGSSACGAKPKSCDHVIEKPSVRDISYVQGFFTIVVEGIRYQFPYPSEE